MSDRPTGSTAFIMENSALRAERDDWYMRALKAAHENERLRALVKTLADDLEEELRGHYNPTMDYPSERRLFERDMANVYEARKALERK